LHFGVSAEGAGLSDEVAFLPMPLSNDLSLLLEVPDTLPGLAADLVRRQVNVIACISGAPAALAMCE
jgi:hypothetical protein